MLPKRRFRKDEPKMNQRIVETCDLLVFWVRFEFRFRVSYNELLDLTTDSRCVVRMMAH